MLTGNKLNLLFCTSLIILLSSCRQPLAAGGAIPRNYLLDREGRIIAIDLYDEELIKKLEELTMK